MRGGSNPAPMETPLSIAALVLADELAAGRQQPIAEFTLDGVQIEVARGRDSIWALIRRPGHGGLALRLAHAPGGIHRVRRLARGRDASLRLRVTGAVGVQDLTLALDEARLPMLRARVELTPAAPLLITHWPRDLYPLGRMDRVDLAQGVVEAAQRGLNTGLCYARLTDPAFGSFLYVQNYSALNDYFRATGTKPDGSVGGLWPELGYLAPTPRQAPVPPHLPLPAGQATTISDVRLVLDADPEDSEVAVAQRFLRMLATVYRDIDRPTPVYRDWIGRAEQTARDLAQSPKATIRHYGHTYVRPYTDAEYPDSMVQMSLVGALHDWGQWRDDPHPLEGELFAGMGKFSDRDLKTIRRYLPNVGADKDADAVDSWYLYHPLTNLAKLALAGSAKARALFLGGLEHAIAAARHFNYVWPIQYRVTDFEVITAARNDDGLGQTDVGGIYAWVMLQAHALTGEAQYLDEACAALAAADGMRFELNYQANLTAWGAAACMRLWRISNEEVWLHRSYVYLASFFHNAEMWESRIGNAAHFDNFLAVTCLHDGPYMALYECFDSFCAFDCYLRDAGPALDTAVRVMVSEYCKYALHRAWAYYPDTLPEDMLATDIRNGHIDRGLSFPLEDLYADGQPAGQIGQEIYGAGAAFAFAARSYRRIAGAPFVLYCDGFVLGEERMAERAVAIALGGGEGYEALLSLLHDGEPPRVRVETADGTRLRPRHQGDGRIDYTVPAMGRLILRW